MKIQFQWIFQIYKLFTHRVFGVKSPASFKSVQALDDAFFFLVACLFL